MAGVNQAGSYQQAEHKMLPACDCLLPANLC
jgi:hypothetical protein